MNLAFAVLADYVADGNGKLYISGTFDVFGATQFPAVLPSAGLAIKIAGTHGESGSHKFSIALRDEDGQLVVPQQIAGEFQLVAGKFAKGAPPTVQVPMMFGGLQFAKPGTYEFEIMVDGRHLGSVPFYVVQAVPAAQAA